MTPETIPADVYRLLCEKKLGKDVDVDAVLDEFASECRQILADALKPDQPRNTIRLSGVGKPNRKVWNDVNGVKPEPLMGHTRMKFLFGHLTESLLLSLVELSGHEVSEKQKTKKVAGVRGSQDCRIDGVLADVKSASSYGFKKFREGTLAADDPFGYIAQIKAYAHEDGDTTYGWLAMDKQNGHLCWLQYDESDTSHPMHKYLNWDVEARVKELKKLVASPLIPSLCYEPVKDGESGNTKLGIACSYCEYKAECFPGLRTFLYSTGPRYLVDVGKEPRVTELLRDF